MMNPVESLRDDLLKRFPNISAEIDAPADPAGLWHLDVNPGVDSPWIVVEWKPGMGFGVSTPGPYDYGMKPDELYADTKAAYDRVVRLVLSRGRTDSPMQAQLGEQRLHKLSQDRIANREKPDIEDREDIRVSTLHQIAAAMGGTLSMRVLFSDGTARELTGLVPAETVAQVK